MANSELQDITKKTIKNIDTILRNLIKKEQKTNGVLAHNLGVHKSNKSRLLNRLVELSILKKTKEGKKNTYHLSDYLASKFKNKKITLYTLYKEVRDLLEYHYDGKIKKKGMPDRISLKREDIKYLMAIEGLLYLFDAIKNNYINLEDPKRILKKYLVERYGTKYIDRTINSIMDVFEEPNKWHNILDKIQKNQIRDINLLSFTPLLDSKRSLKDKIISFFNEN